MDKISKLRHEIDSVDKSIFTAILKRIEIARKIFLEKKMLGANITDISREQNLLKSLSKEFSGRLPTVLIEDLIKSIIRTEKIRYNYDEDRSLLSILSDRPILIAGPCTIESEEQMMRISRKVASHGVKLLRGGAFKPRTSPHSFQGLGDEGIDFIRSAANELDMYVVSEVLDEKNLEKHYDKIDMIQIGSRNMTSSGFLKEVGKVTCKDEKPILLKRGFASTLKEFLYAAEYVAAENDNIVLCLRGIRTFEQIESQLRFTPDLASIIELKSMTKYPIIFDPSHAAGASHFVMPLAKAALSLDADGLMIECHDYPQEAPVDAFQAVHPDELSQITGF